MFAEIQNSESTEGSISQESTNEEDESADTGKISVDEQLKFYPEQFILFVETCANCLTAA
ncbi:hypothetical protein [Marinilactibacillus psychrotolerans]|uniref:hypothetical protein n=1 Tax=Marinilactibacillus psychrotolerans TaxID=191770 RepID=UPI003885A08F